ncbi:hypothetical protein BT96DRAFT_1000702 [Gymnopus androsaceus JB14]|uniref:Uncharacterized protein n=1 Tax=Gymnopus androsaceus JB14 TaxID=1447944 RepID=A0A6A4H1H3_9AGAR|nr:hypothetical protein BT96DRAFT_1000702 [Gymnopus androsaceus JB14]
MNNKLNKLFTGIERLKDVVKSDRDKIKTQEEDNLTALDQLQENMEELRETLIDIPNKLEVSDENLNDQLKEAHAILPSSEEWNEEFLHGLLCRGAQAEATRALVMNTLLPESLIDPKLLQASQELVELLQDNADRSSIDRIIELYTALQCSSLVTLENLFKFLADQSKCSS